MGRTLERLGFQWSSRPCRGRLWAKVQKPASPTA